jgi:hypothetical protein
MRALGRLYDVVAGLADANTITVCLKDCSGIGFVLGALQTATATLAVSGTNKYSGGTTTVWTPANGFGQPGTYYYRSAPTAAWTAASTSWSSNTVTLSATSGYTSYVDFLVSELADTYDYIKVVAGASTRVHAILYDLTVQRTPANLRIPSA